ncbi:MAG: hypothetical protein K2Y31_18090 [Burkholderiales bacterium]|jgi:hypothetical protein|nr:hypothetical protein [Burkholderiales bacterium]
MLREIRNTQQVPGESPRRWFFSHEQDFLVWFGDDGQPEAFQLAYSKYRDEKAIRWKAGRGFTHYQVDDGEKSGMGKEAAILHPDGAFKAKQVLDQFLAVSKEVPKEIVDFVAARLREHPEYHENP